MSLFKKLAGGGPERKKDLTAREACALALEALGAAHPQEADRAQLCCVYTSVFDADVSLQADGTCRAWHFDFFLPVSRNLYLVRVEKGKTRVKETPWEKTRERPIEYIFARYGAQSEQGAMVEPPRVPEKWLDSPAITAAMQMVLEPHHDPKRGEELAPVALCLPAEHLRYLQEDKARKLLSFPPPAGDCFAAICTSDELYEDDCYLLYIEAATGKVLEEYAFRFPNLFYFGDSRNW